MGPEHTITFDFTVDEAVALQIECARATREGAAWKRREQAKFVASCALVIAIVLILSNQSASILGKAGLIAAAGAISLLLVVPFGWYYDRVVVSRTRRALLERFGVGPYPSTVRVLNDGLLVDQNGLELKFSWSDGATVEDREPGVLVAFRGGSVFVPRRAFPSRESQVAFVRNCTQQVARASATPAPSQ
jgi:hypothetical protein